MGAWRFVEGLCGVHGGVLRGLCGVLGGVLMGLYGCLEVC